MNRQLLLAKRPSGRVDNTTLELVERPIPEPGDGQVVIRNLLLSLDPTNRVWMNEADSYLPAVEIGAVMRGIAAGRVVASRAKGFAEGDLVSGVTGWCDYAAIDASQVNKIPPGVPLSAALSVFGHIGLTAYFGLLEVGAPKKGETVLVSGAAGATGSLVGQIAKLQGCRVVGTAGGPDKCAWLRDLGFDAAIDYKSAELNEAVASACPNGIDVFFDNVGGPILDVALAHLALRGRVVLCGAISQYNASEPKGPAGYLNLIPKRGRMEGFIVLDYLARALEAIGPLATWVQQGKLRYKVDIVDGLEQAPSALNRLFDGKNDGKLLVRVAEDEAAH
jgi:NADPH-dependent curcumin reductase CurA